MCDGSAFAAQAKIPELGQVCASICVGMRLFPSILLSNKIGEKKLLYRTSGFNPVFAVTCLDKMAKLRIKIWLTKCRC